MIIISLKTIVEVDVGKLNRNVLEIKNLISTGTKICAVIKADAYGHGAVGVARSIESAVDYFAVALVEEGVELRLCGIEKPILLLLPTDKEGVERALRYNLTLAIENAGYGRYVAACAKRIKIAADIHIKVNTGMNRFGFSVDRIDEICKFISKSRYLKITGVFSHFYNCEDKIETERQFAEFIKAKCVVKSYAENAICHISASGGILLGRKYDLDMVRPGILLYGYTPFKTDVINVEPILCVKAKVLKTAIVKSGENLLYGNYKLSKSKRISIVRAGYADGLRRNKALTINNNCMDVSAIEYCKSNYASVFNNAEFVAEKENTIPYEILCGISHRSHIVYKE